MEKELDDIAEGELGKVQMLHEFNGPFERALEKAEHSFERFSEELDEECPLCPTEGREPGKLEVKLGRYGKFVGCTNYPECRYIRNMDGSVRPEPEMLDETCPECGRQLQKRVGRFGPFIGCSGYPDCKYIKKDPPVSTGVTCPQCGEGELVEKRSRFGTMFYSCSRYPDCDFAVGNPPEKDHPCPECGSLLLPPAQVVRCWDCGAELDLEFNVTKSGDVEAEAAAREAKAAAKAARAAAKKPTAKKATAKKRQRRRRRRTTKKKTTRAKTPRPAKTTSAARTKPSGRRRARRSWLPSPTRSPRSAGPVGDPEGPAHPPGVLAAARRDDHLLAGRLGGVRGGDLARHHAVRVRREGRVRDRRGDDGADAAGDPVRPDRGRASSTGSTASRS